jgi:hypothetical protein
MLKLDPRCPSLQNYKKNNYLLVKLLHTAAQTDHLHARKRNFVNITIYPYYNNNKKKEKNKCKIVYFKDQCIIPLCTIQKQGNNYK